MPVFQSKRNTGFIGFIICLNSMLKLYSRFIETNKFNYIRMYKLSQDHLELFFENIRSQGGHNNNPTTKQFRSAHQMLNCSN